MKMIRRVLAARVAWMTIAPVLTLAGCGDGGSDTSSAAPTESAAAANTADAAAGASTGTSAGTTGSTTAASGASAASSTASATSGTVAANVMVSTVRPVPTATTSASTDKTSTSTSTSTSTTTTTTQVATKASSAAIVPVVSGGYSILDGNIARLFGPGLFTMDSLANRIVGDYNGYTWVTSQRFRAPMSGSVASVRPYWAAGPGYAAGNGGTIRIRLMPDDGTANHLPNMSATPLATLNYQPQLSGGSLSATTFDAAASFPTPAAITAGTIYHVVYDNVGPSPGSNFISVNYQATVPQNGRNSRWLSPYDWGEVIGYRGIGSSGAYTWRDEAVNGSTSGGAFYAPILQLTMTDGRSFGQTDMETGNIAGRSWTITSSTPVRERFTPKSARTISAVSFATATRTGGSLRWEIRDGTTLLASGSVSESQANYATSGALGHTTPVLKWYDAALPANVSMAANKTYDLILLPEGSSSWEFSDERNGSAYRYSAPAAWTESQAQVFNGSTWLNANHWDHSSSVGGSNWSVMLHLAP